jgi:hypothetical protein
MKMPYVDCGVILAEFLTACFLLKKQKFPILNTILQHQQYVSYIYDSNTVELVLSSHPLLSGHVAKSRKFHNIIHILFFFWSEPNLSNGMVVFIFCWPWLRHLCMFKFIYTKNPTSNVLKIDLMFGISWPPKE